MKEVAAVVLGVVLGLGAIFAFGGMIVLALSVSEMFHLT